MATAVRIRWQFHPDRRHSLEEADADNDDIYWPYHLSLENGVVVTRYGGYCEYGEFVVAYRQSDGKNEWMDIGNEAFTAIPGALVLEPGIFLTPQETVDYPSIGSKSTAPCFKMDR